MEFNTYVASIADLEKCQAAGIKEVLIGPAKLSRFGKLTMLEAENLARAAKDKRLSPVLVWDILMTENELESCIKNLLEISDLKLFDAIRVQDLGALCWVFEELAPTKIHYIAETANANLPALNTWEKYLGDRLERLILSQQLTEEKLVDLIKALKTPCELLVAGPILLFYSPRPLLSAKLSDTDEAFDANAEKQHWLQALSSSEESQHREFPTIENTHGTFMFLNKDQFLLDRLEQVQAAGLKFGRIDLRQISAEQNEAEGILELITAYNEGVADPKAHWPKPAFAPFFRRNQTTKQFSKLKPQIQQIRTEQCVAKVIMGEKPKQVVMWALRDFNKSQRYKLTMPNGQVVEGLSLTFKDLDGHETAELKEDQVFLSPWIKGACAGALLVEE